MLDFIIDESRCVQCGECVADCPVSIIDLDGDFPRIPTHKEGHCIRCQHCLAVCPTAALSILGVDPDRVADLRAPAPDAVENLLKGRRSVRRYLAQAVAPELLDRLMEVAAHAPTGKNQRQIRFTLVDDPAVMAAIRERTIEGIRRASIDNTLPVGMEYFAKFVSHYDLGRDIIFRDAPHMLVVSAPETSPTPEADPYIALTYFEIMAAALGLGTVWCGFAAWAISRVVPELRDMLGIPRNHRSLYAMMFGYPAMHYARVVRRDVRDAHRVTLADLEAAR